LATILGVFLYPMLFIAVGKFFKFEEKRDAKVKASES